MAIPWIGFPCALLKRSSRPAGEVRGVHDPPGPGAGPGQKKACSIARWTGRTRKGSARRGDDPLTLLAVGLYGEVLPNQNGAPSGS